MSQPRSERSLGELFADLSRDLTTLIHQEIRLAQAEITSSVTSLARDGALIAAGGLLLYAAFLGLMATVAIGLTQAGLSAWLAWLVVTIVVAGVGVALIATGRSAIARRDMAPSRTIETLKDDAEWARERTR